MAVTLVIKHVIGMYLRRLSTVEDVLATSCIIGVFQSGYVAM